MRHTSSTDGGARPAVLYLGYYSCPELEAQGRPVVPAAQDKMGYIVAVLNEIGLRVRLVSALHTRSTYGYPRLDMDMPDGNSIRAFRALRYGGLIRRLTRSIWMHVALFTLLMREGERGRSVIAYHSLGYAATLALAQFVKGFRLVLEVEELYSDISERRMDLWRERVVFSRAHAFIIPTEELNAVVNCRRRPYAIVHGAYAPVHPGGRRFPGRRIHAVYAGTLDARKGGAIAAVDAARYLDGRYHVHVIGFGSENELAAVQRRIEEVNASGTCRVTYDGLLSGQDYSRFLESCDIGLSTHRMEGAFNATSFPSKVLSYMRHGLRVVSARIQVVESSAVSRLVSFYDEDTPEAIAAAIEAVNLADPYEPRLALWELHRDFVGRLSCILGV